MTLLFGKFPLTNFHLTSILGTPLGAGGIPVKSKLPSNVLPVVNFLSPWYIFIVTTSWLSTAVENICPFDVGTAVFLLIG